MFHITSRAYELYFACRTLISNWIDRCFGQLLWNSVHNLSRDNPRIPTNPLSGSQQPPLLWGQWIRTQSSSKLPRALQPCLIQTKLLFSSIVHEGVFCGRYNSVPLIWRLSVTAYTTCLFVTAYIWFFFVRIYMRVCKKMVIYFGIKCKYTWQKTHVYRVAGMIASIRGKKPHVYCVIILKQMADHTSLHSS